MKSTLMFIKEFILSLIIIVSTAFTFVSPDYVSYSPIDPEEVKMSFSVIADTHVETNNSETFGVFNKVLTEIKHAEKNDALVLLGDNVMNGQMSECLLLYGALNAHKPSENIHLITGNHDLGNGGGEYEKLSKRFITCNNLTFDAELTKPYYYKEYDHCFMIFLSSEKAIVDLSHISDRQYQWLEETLQKAEASGKPIFVFHHHPLFYITGDVWRLQELLCQYDNLFYLFGHLHMLPTCYELYGVNCIALPRVTETVSYTSGIGAVIEIYDDSVEVRSRNFYDGEWYYEAHSYPLEKAD